MIILDTDILVAYLRNNIDAKRWIERNESDNPFFVTPIQLLELFKGAYLSKKKLANVNEVKKLLSSIELLPISKTSTEIFGKLYYELKSKGDFIGDFDLIIGAIAICNGMRIVTRNFEHFKKIQSLLIEKW